MSLLSRTIFYDANGIEVHRECINIGWWINEDAWINVIYEQVPKHPTAKMVEVYDIKFPVKWLRPRYEDLLRKLYQERS